MQQDEVHGLCRVVLLAADSSSDCCLRPLGGGSQSCHQFQAVAAPSRYKKLFHRVVACGSALVASSRGNGCASLAMPFFVLCTRIELLFPCSFVPLSAVPCCFVPAVCSFVRWFTVYGFFNHFAISIVLNNCSLTHMHWATPFLKRNLHFRLFRDRLNGFRSVGGLISNL